MYNRYVFIYIYITYQVQPLFLTKHIPIVKKKTNGAPLPAILRLWQQHPLPSTVSQEGAAKTLELLDGRSAAARLSHVEPRDPRGSRGKKWVVGHVSYRKIYTWWLIPLNKWVITLVINGISGGNVHLYLGL